MSTADRFIPSPPPTRAARAPGERVRNTPTWVSTVSEHNFIGCEVLVVREIFAGTATFAGEQNRPPFRGTAADWRKCAGCSESAVRVFHGDRGAEPGDRVALQFPVAADHHGELSVLGDEGVRTQFVIDEQGGVAAVGDVEGPGGGVARPGVAVGFQPN